MFGPVPIASGAVNRLVWSCNMPDFSDKAGQRNNSRLICLLAAIGSFVVLAAFASASRADPPIVLKVVGGLGGVSQYERLEKPFWQNGIEALTGGRMQAEIHPFDRSGLPGQEMLQLMRLGVVPVGTALLAVVSADEPELNLIDLPALNPDMATLRRTVAAYRPHLQELLEGEFQIKLLAIYAYPAQVLFCTSEFDGLAGLAGRRVRTSSVGQSEMMSALGASPVVMPFAQVVPAISQGTVDCAITGTLSGNEIGLSNVTSYIYPMAISWGLSVFGANMATWNALPEDLRATLQSGLGDLEAKIWAAADRETAEGLACDTGAPGCGPAHHASHMTPVPISKQDEALRQWLLRSAVLPDWLRRCGADCLHTWDKTVGPALGITLPLAQVGGQ
jgi:TRAP-type C4-dicarboxylate transport system substrate-binding protein